MAPAEAWFLRAWRRELVGDLTGTVVEIGAGTGLNLPFYRAGTVVHALEPDAAMRARLGSRAGPHVHVHADRAEALPFPDGSIDAVIGTLVLCSVDDPDRAVAEVFRVLQPGGVYRFLEHVRADGWRGGLQRALDPVWSRCAGNCHLRRDPLRAVRHHAEPRVRTEYPVAVPPFLLPLIRGEARKR